MISSEQEKLSQKKTIEESQNFRVKKALKNKLNRLALIIL
jgi:hypothetical protein